MTNRPHFETFKDTDGEWRWRLKGANGEIVATSEAYTRQADAVRGINDAREAAAQAPSEAQIETH